MIDIEHDREAYLVCRVSGRLTAADYETAIPELEHELALHDGALRLLVVLEDFRGWEIGALWEELRFDIRHGNDFGRVAVVGESKWEEWGTRLSKPFFGAQVRYFDRAERDQAQAWLAETEDAAAGPPPAQP